jgi:hypothetical protein
MPNTMSLIASATATSGTSVAAFTSIPGTYTDLRILISARDSYTSGGGNSMNIQFNGVTTTYNSKYLQSYAASSLDNGTETTTTYGGITGSPMRAVVNGAATASTFGNTEIYISNYSTSNFKSWSINGVAEDNAGGATSQNGVSMTAGLWSNTSAITSISFGLEVGSFVSPSTFYLYGIKKD